MNYCPQCGHQLSPNQKFCPECGCDLSAQSEFAKVYDTVCPDCGKVFKEIIPASCPNCGCPSSMFQQQKEKNKEVAKSNDNDKIKHFLVFLVMLGIVCGVGYTIYSSGQKNAEKQRYELQEKERVQRERQEQKERQEQENRNKERMKMLCKNAWKYYRGDPYGKCLVEWISFNPKGEGYDRMVYFVGGNIINESGFSFKYSMNGDYIYVGGDKTFYYNGSVLKKCHSGEIYEEVSRYDF